MILALYSFLAIYVLWIFYLAVMNLMRANDNNSIGKIAFIFGCPILIVGVTIDMLVNVFIMTFLFLDLPRELLLTKRLARLIRHNPGWRGKLAKWVCSNLLDTFDPSGKHCH